MDRGQITEQLRDLTKKLKTEMTRISHSKEQTLTENYIQWKQQYDELKRQHDQLGKETTNTPSIFKEAETKTNSESLSMSRK